MQSHWGKQSMLLNFPRKSEETPQVIMEYIRTFSADVFPQQTLQFKSAFVGNGSDFGLET